MLKEKEQEERGALSELKNRMLDIPDKEMYGNDNLLYRFLQARNFNVDEAEKMFKEHLEWRKKYDVRNISKCKHPEVLEKYLAFNKLGRDKEGCIVRYIPSGKIDWIGINASCRIEDLEKYLIYCFEEDSLEIQKDVESGKIDKVDRKFVFIHNLEDFTLVKATDKKTVFRFIVLINLFLNNYPETLKTIIIINASSYFHLLFSLLQKFLPSSLLKKIKIYSDDSWKVDFPKIIDAEVLPAFLGGERKDSDGNPLCTTFINHGETVPEKYYIHRKNRSLSNLSNFEKLTLSRANFHEVFLEVKGPDCYLEWEFETESRDIGFGIFYEDNEGNKTEIIPIMRINTDEYSETGVYKCERVGKYIVIFDNTYSYFRKKDIYYKIKILNEQEEDLRTAI